MRHMLRGFTMWIDGLDYGIDTEEVEINIPTSVMQEYRGGGMDLGVNLAMMALEPLEVTIKMSSSNPDILKRVGKAPGNRDRITFRAAALDELTGDLHTHVAIVEGNFTDGTRDRWQRGEKSGIEYGVKSIIYFKYEIDSDVIHDISAWPAKRIVNGVDQLAGINEALGY